MIKKIVILSVACILVISCNKANNKIFWGKRVGETVHKDWCSDVSSLDSLGTVTQKLNGVIVKAKGFIKNNTFIYSGQLIPDKRYQNIRFVFKLFITDKDCVIQSVHSAELTYRGRYFYFEEPYFDGMRSSIYYEPY